MASSDPALKTKATWTKDLPGHTWAFKAGKGFFCLKCGWFSADCDPPKRPCVGPGKAP